jgi:hypothetical protein
VLVNARQLHHVPGRKTDGIDCQWLQTLHRCGLLRGSFRPTKAIKRRGEQHMRAAPWRFTGIMSAEKSLGYSLVSVEEEIRAES